MEIFVQAAGYLGDLMLLHDVATSTWSCSFRLVGALEIFLVFVQAEEYNLHLKKLELSAEDTWPLFRREVRGDASRRGASAWVGMG